MTTTKTMTKTAPKAAKPQAKAAKKASAKKSEPQATKPATIQRPAKEKAPGKLSLLAAAAKVLAESGEPMTSKAMIDAMAAKGYWTSPGGATPWATLYSALIREIATKGTEARFAKSERGHFTLAAK